MTLFKMLCKLAFWIAFATTVGGLIPSSIWLSQYSFLGVSGTRAPLDTFFMFGAIPGALIGILIGVSKATKDATPEQISAIEGIGFISVGLLAASVGGWHFVRTLSKADWPSVEARFERIVRKSNTPSYAIFKYLEGGGEVRLRPQWFSRFSEGEVRTVYINAKYRDSSSLTNRPGYVGLSIALAIALAVIVKGVLHMRSTAEP